MTGPSNLFILGALGAAALSAGPAAGQDVQERAPVLQQVVPGRLGVQFTFRREYTFGSQEPPRTEVLIDAVLPGGAADRAGLRVGDRIEQINGMSPSEALIMEIGPELKAGDSLRFLLRRADRTVDQWVVAEARPMTEPHVERRGFFADAPRPLRRAEVGDGSAPDRGFTIVWGPASGQQFTYRFQTEAGDVPFEAFVVRTPQTDSLMALIRVVQSQIRAAQVLELRNHAERDALLPVQLARRLDELQHELASVSRERLRLTELARDRGEIRVRVAPRVALAPLVQSNRAFLLGAEVTSVSGELGAYFDVESGVLVSSVHEGTPAHRAGLRPGDVIVATSRGAVQDLGQLRQHLVTGGTGIELTVVRSGNRRAVRFPDSQ